MAVKLGQDWDIGIVAQASFGRTAIVTSAGDPVLILDPGEFSDNPNLTWIPFEVIQKEAVQEYVQGSWKPQFMFSNVPVYADGTRVDPYTLMLYHMFGTGTNAAPTGHTEGTEGVPFTMTVTDGSQYWLYGSCVIDEITFTGERDKIISMNVKGFCQYIEAQTSTTFDLFYSGIATAPSAIGALTPYPCQGDELQYQLAGGGYTALTKVSSWSVTLKRNISIDKSMGKVTGNDSKVYVVPIDFVTGAFNATAEFTIPALEDYTFDDPMYLGDMSAQNAAEIDMKFTIGGKTLTLAGGRITGDTKKVTKRGEVSQTVKVGHSFQTLAIA